MQIDATSGSVPSANAPILYVTGGAIGRIGVGTTAPSAQLHVSSSSDETLFRIDGGTGHAAGTPILFVASESGSAGVGSVGINTATPNAAKYVLDTPVSGVIKGGNIEMGSYSPSPGYGFLGHSTHNHHGAGGTNKYSLLIGSSGDLSLNAALTSHMYFRAAGTIKAAIHSNGYFAIGQNAGATWTPAAQLHVSASTGALFQIDATSGSVPSANAPILFVTGGAIGRIGLGTTSPASALDIRGTVQVGVDDTGHDVKFFGATAGQYMLWDEATDELILAGDTKLSFHDGAGNENIIATADGHLEVNAGATLDMTAPTIDLNASTAVTIDGPSVTFADNTSQKPLVIIKNTTNDAEAARLRFVKDKGAAGAANDVAGIIEFYADDANQDNIAFASITGSVKVHTNGQEGGKLTLGVASHDGELTTGLTIEDGILEDQVLVSVGAATPTSIFHTSGSHAGGVAVCTADATLDDTHFIVTFQATDGVTGTLPAKAGCVGRIYHIINEIGDGTTNCDGGPCQPNPLVITGNGSETINGETNVAVDMNSGQHSISLVNLGDEWAILGLYSQSEEGG